MVAHRWLTVWIPLMLVAGCEESPAEPGGPLALVEVTPAFAGPEVGEAVQLRATAKDDLGQALSGQQVSWTSSDEAVASVTSGGLVTGIAAGNAIVTATIGAFTGSATITVEPCSIVHARQITVGETAGGDLAETDCQLSDLTFVDGYLIQLQQTANIQVDLRATFDTYLVLLELLPSGELLLLSVNDDVDPDDPASPDDPVDTNSQIVYTMAAGTPYFILANSFSPNITGDYQLTVTEVASLALKSSATSKPGKAPIEMWLRGLRK
jgi:hypothetical protein